MEYPAPETEEAEGGGKQWKSGGFGYGSNTAGGDRRANGGGYRQISRPVPEKIGANGPPNSTPKATSTVRTSPDVLACSPAADRGVGRRGQGERGVGAVRASPAEPPDLCGGSGPEFEDGTAGDMSSLTSWSPNFSSADFFRREYGGVTLREHRGLPRPDNQFFPLGRPSKVT